MLWIDNYSTGAKQNIQKFLKNFRLSFMDYKCYPDIGCREAFRIRLCLKSQNREGMFCTEYCGMRRFIHLR